LASLAHQEEESSNAGESKANPKKGAESKANPKKGAESSFPTTLIDSELLETVKRERDELLEENSLLKAADRQQTTPDTIKAPKEGEDWHLKGRDWMAERLAATENALRAANMKLLGIPEEAPSSGSVDGAWLLKRLDEEKESLHAQGHSATTLEAALEDEMPRHLPQGGRDWLVNRLARAENAIRTQQPQCETPTMEDARIAMERARSKESASEEAISKAEEKAVLLEKEISRLEEDLRRAGREGLPSLGSSEEALRTLSERLLTAEASTRARSKELDEMEAQMGAVKTALSSTEVDLERERSLKIDLADRLLSANSEESQHEKDVARLEAALEAANKLAVDKSEGHADDVAVELSYQLATAEKALRAKET